MGTRGLTGFVIDGKVKAGYQQFDSYPDGVGVQVLGWLRQAVELPGWAEGGAGEMAQKARDLTVVDGETPPTPKETEALLRYANLEVSTQSTDDWYCLLRETQGRPDAMLRAG